MRIIKIEVEKYHIEVVYKNGFRKRLDWLLEDAAGRTSDHSGMCLMGDQARDLVWEFGLSEFHTVVAVANRLSRVRPTLMSVHVYIDYLGPYKSTRLDWHKSEKEILSARDNQDDKEGTEIHEESNSKD